MLVSQTQATVRGELLAGNMTTSIPGRGLGYADHGSGLTEVIGTLLGDTNLDFKVDVTDLGNLASSYGTSSGALWVQGDTNYDGKVDVTDLGNLASNYGGALAGGPSAGGSAMDATATTSIAAAVPEPAALGICAVGVLALMDRRRRARSKTCPC
jgi:hypothetical protein